MRFARTCRRRYSAPLRNKTPACSFPVDSTGAPNGHPFHSQGLPGKTRRQDARVQGREAEVDVDTGSNAADDRMIDAVQDTRGDLSRDELRKEIMGLNERQQAELVALLWIGRGDAEPDAWEVTVQMARERGDTPTEHYLLGQPLAAEHWEEGADSLILGSISASGGGPTK